MARSEPSCIKDIDEQFCQCPICLQQYREPKVLPCLHRYCSDCLKKLIEGNGEATAANCPECREEFTIPTEGVDGFKADFYMKNIIEYIQIQKSLEQEQQQQCYGCSKTLKVTSYCFKCNGFLCKECYEIHITNKSLEDHKQHVVSLEDLQSKHMTLEKLADLKEAPRCQSHLKDLCLLCCKTCNNLAICVTCTYGSHKNHDINDVGIIAKELREKLKKDLDDLSQNKERMLKMPQAVNRVKEMLLSSIREKKENFTIMHEKDIHTMTNEMKEKEDNFKITQTEIEEDKKKKLRQSNELMDEEIKTIKIKYENICDEIEKESKVQLDNLRQKQEKSLLMRREELAILEREFQTFKKTLEKRQEEGLAKIKEITQQIDGIVERYENLTTTGYSVLETWNDWTAIHCIPDICKAIEPLSDDMKRDFPELDPLSRITVHPEITEDEESPVNIENIEKENWKIDGITTSRDGSIVITGCTSAKYQSHITVIEMKGKVDLLRQETKQHLNESFPRRYCAYLSEFKVATVCESNEIGVFDIRDYSYIKKDISDVISYWPVERRVMCVTTDPVNNHILVGGGDSRDVYVFDDQLNYHHTLTLPEIIKYPLDMAIREGNLLVCDFICHRAYVISTDDQQSKIIHEFQKPEVDQDDWSPMSLCTDSNGFIYILWQTDTCLNKGRRVITQYTEDGRILLTETRINYYARCISTVKTDKAETLLIARWKSGKLHIYKLKLSVIFGP